MSRSISKIKINDKAVVIKYVQHHTTKEGDVRNTTRTIKSEIRPHIQFFEVFQKLKQYAIGYLELTNFKTNIDEDTLSRHVVNAVSITQDTDTTKIIISMTKTLVNGKCFSVSSPMIDLENDDFTEIVDLSSCFDDLIGEADSYLDGKNGEEQMGIKFDSEAEAA